MIILLGKRLWSQDPIQGRDSENRHTETPLNEIKKHRVKEINVLFLKTKYLSFHITTFYVRIRKTQSKKNRDFTLIITIEWVSLSNLLYYVHFTDLVVDHLLFVGK